MLLGSLLAMGDAMPAVLLILFHVFSAVVVLAFAMSWRETMVQKRFLLGLDDASAGPRAV